jgi:hypothetical protein
MQTILTYAKHTGMDVSTTPSLESAFGIKTTRLYGRSALSEQAELTLIHAHYPKTLCPDAAVDTVTPESTYSDFPEDAYSRGRESVSLSLSKSHFRSTLVNPHIQKNTQERRQHQHTTSAMSCYVTNCEKLEQHEGDRSACKP